MSTYTAKIIEDKKGPILIFPEELSRELGWGVDAKVRITGNRNCFRIELLEKGIQEVPADGAK